MRNHFGEARVHKSPPIHPPKFHKNLPRNHRIDLPSISCHFQIKSHHSTHIHGRGKRNLRKLMGTLRCYGGKLEGDGGAWCSSGERVIGWRPACGEAFPTPDTHEVVVFSHFFYGGFSLPTSRFFRGILEFYGISLHHLNPNSIVHIVISSMPARLSWVLDRILPYSATSSSSSPSQIKASRALLGARFSTKGNLVPEILLHALQNLEQWLACKLVLCAKSRASTSRVLLSSSSISRHLELASHGR